VTVLTVGADGPTFIDDMTAVFKRNVARARRDNKHLRAKADANAAKA
jgi:hypothetical protein